MLIILLGLSGAALALAAIYQFSRNVYLGWIAYLACSCYNLTFGTSQYSLGPLHLDLLDGIRICLLVAGIIRTANRLHERNTARVLGLSYLVLFSINFVIGATQFGLPAAANECRVFSSAVLAILYFLTAPADNESLLKYLRAYYVYAAILIVVAIFAHFGFDVGTAAWSHHSVDTSVETRELPVIAAIAIAICFFFSLIRTTHWSHSAIDKVLPILFLISAIYLRHRTVWSVLLVGSVTLFFVDGKAFRRLIPVMLLGSVLITVLYVADLKNSQTQTTEGQFESSATDEGTFIWRVQGWIQVIWDEDQTTWTFLFGKSFGGGNWRFDPSQGTYINVPPHSEYIGQFSRVGVVGLILLLGFILSPVSKLRQVWRIDRLAIQPSAGAWLVIIAAALTYAVTYSIETDLYAFVGLANGVALLANHEVESEEESFDPEFSQAVLT